jgi:hypothetical protein
MTQITLKEAFYAQYTPLYQRISKTTNLLTQEKYDHILDTMLSYDALRTSERTGEARRYHLKYRLEGNVRSTMLRRQMKGKWMQVPTFETVYDIIHKTHTATLGHAKNKRKNKVHINSMYYGVPTSAITLYLSLCPNCAVGKKISKKSKRLPLKMMLSQRVGQRCQVDLIDMGRPNPITGDRYILRYADHLSAYGYCRPLRNRDSKTTGDALVQILSESIQPTILQSDNGSEFLGQ